MGFTNTHGWTYISTAYYPNAPSSTRRLGTYYNDSGSSKKITSVTFYCATGSGNKPSADAWGDAVNGNGKSITMRLVINGVTSDEVTISNTASVYKSSSGNMSYTEASCTAKTFKFTDGPVISNGSTVDITASLSGSGSVLVVRSVRSGVTYISGTVVDPYTAPSYSIQSISPLIGTINSTNYTVTYSITGGTNSINWTHLKVYDVNNNLKQTIDLSKTSKGDNLTSTFKLSSSVFSDGSQYKASIEFNDNKNTFETSKLNCYTYRTPKISNISVSPQNFSGIGNGTLKWTTNTRRWTTNPTENAFKTYIKFENKSWFESSNNEPSANDTTNSMYNKEQTITESIINTQFTSAERSSDKISTNIYVRRTNPSSGVNADSSAYAITIQLKPKYSPSSVNYYNNDTNDQLTKGSIVYIDQCPKIKISWTYPNSADRGIINGYIVRIYSDSNRTNKISEHIVNTSSLESNVIVDIRKDLKRGQLNYVSIVAFYNKPNGTGRFESNALQEDFILPLGRIHKPIIEYPISNTIWHNDNFRILLQSPEDDDYDTYDDSIISNYKYRNVELKINNTILSLYNATENSSNGSIPSGVIFCNNSIKHKAKICINPSLSGSFIVSDTFKISIRYQKNYYQYIWSEWSDEIILKKSNISELSEIQADNPILAAHYNKMRNYSVRLWQVYPLQQLESKNILCEPATDDSTKNDYIKQDNYAAIYNTILGIQNNVNSYADSYDDNRQTCKFLQVIDKLSNDNSVTEELVTASKDPRPNISGRNYINILIECMNKLF